MTDQVREDTKADLPPGFLTDRDIAILQERLAGLRVLELGSYLGRSTVAIAQVAEHVTSVDHHRGSAEHWPGGRYHDPALMRWDKLGAYWSLPVFLANLTTARVLDNVSLCVMPTADYARYHARAHVFDAAFIDTEHTFAQVMHDGRLAAHCVKAGGLLLFHDAIGWPGVTQAVATLAESTHQEPEDVSRHPEGSIVILRSWVGA